MRALFLSLRLTKGRGAGSSGPKGAPFRGAGIGGGSAKGGQRKVPSMTKIDLIVTNIAISVNVPSESTKVPSQST